MQKNMGFNLIEILLALTIMAVLIAIGVPNFKNLLQQSEQKIQRLQLIQVLQFARQWSMTANATTAVGGLNAGMYLEVSNAANIIYQSPQPHKNQIYWRAFPKNIHEINFSSGQTNFENGTLWYCLPQSSSPSWAILIGQSGHIRTVFPDQKGVIIDERGHPLNC